MREIIFDTETTGFDPLQGDRVVEIGCVEVINLIPTGQTFHVYINPQRDMPEGAFKVHGLSTEFLSDKPLFADIADDFLAFIGTDSKLVAHNASFDMKFINAELGWLKRPALANDRVVDTLILARRRHPGGSNKLDDLCTRYGIDNSRRTKHGALLDAELLAEVYAELMGGRQASLGLSVEAATRVVVQADEEVRTVQARPAPLPSRLSAEDEAQHAAFVKTLGENASWRNYLPAEGE